MTPNSSLEKGRRKCAAHISEVVEQPLSGKLYSRSGSVATIPNTHLLTNQAVPLRRLPIGYA